MKKLLLHTVLTALISTGFVKSQNITNTLGTSGVFTIKYGSTTFFSLSQFTGDLTLTTNINFPYSGLSTQGVIYRGGLRFIHDYFNPATNGLNTFIGLNSGNFTMGGTSDQASYNTGTGALTLTSLTTGNYNSALGVGALNLNSTGSGNSAFGYSALNHNTIGTGNSAFGVNSLTSNSTGYANAAFGGGSMYENTTGYYNSAFGDLSMLNNTIGRQNTAVGYKSLYSNVSGFQNTAVGDSSLYKNTGNYNTAIGYNAGSNVTTGANLTLIGIDANPSSPTAIDQITLGNQFVQSLRCNVQTITSLSDARDKKNIKDLTLGLDFITKLKPRQFNWDRREWYEGEISDGSKMQENPTAGFIAQEFDELQKSENAEWLNLVLKDNPEKWEATYGNLLPVMVKAIQELYEKNEQLETENEKLRSEMENLKSLKEEMAKIQNLQVELIDQRKFLEAKSKSSDTEFTLIEKELE